MLPYYYRQYYMFKFGGCNSICCWVQTRNDIQPDRSLRHVMLNLRLGLWSHCLTTILHSSVSAAPAESPFYKLHWCWGHSSHKGHQSSGRQTIWATDKWATNQPGDSQLQYGRHILVNWATEVGMGHNCRVWTINDCRAGAMCSHRTEIVYIFNFIRT